jgi:hypothetical protein
LKGDRSTREHDQGEGGFGAVEASGPADDQAYDVVETLGPPVVEVQPDGGEQAVAELADRLGGLDERGQARAAGPGDPPVDQLGDLAAVQVTGEDRTEGLLQVLQQRPAGALELARRFGVAGLAQLVPGLAPFVVRSWAASRAMTTASFSSVVSTVRSSPRRAHDISIGWTHTNGIPRSPAS